MARTDLRHSTIQLVPESPDHLSRRFWGRLFSIDLSHPAIGRGRVPEQHRVVCSDNFAFWFGDSFAGTADHSLSDVRRHSVCGAVLHGSGANRIEIRYGPRPPSGNDAGVRAAVSPRILALFHLAAL